MTTRTTIPITDRMVLIWSRYDYNHEYDSKSIVNEDIITTTTCITLEPSANKITILSVIKI